MARAVLLVMDSVGCGGAPDAAEFGDAGANTLGHIVRFRAEARRPLHVPNLAALGLGNAIRAASGIDLPGFALSGGSIQSQDTAFSFNLSSLGALAPDQAVTVAIAMSTNRNNQFNFGNTLDNIVLDPSIVIPEPSSLALLGLGAGLLTILRLRVSKQLA